MDRAGNISTFSPELLGLKNAAYEDFSFGNINRDALVDLPRRPNFVTLYSDIRKGVEMCRDRCGYFSVCGGGEPVNKLAENGTFVSTETAYCRLTKMRVTDLVLDTLDRVQPRDVGRAAGAAVPHPALDAAAARQPVLVEEPVTVQRYAADRTVVQCALHDIGVNGRAGHQQQRAELSCGGVTG